MNARRPVAGIALCLALALGAPIWHGCALSTATVQTDPAVIAQRATRILKVLEVVVDSLILVRDAGWISQPVNKAIQDDILAAIPVITKTPDGARATAIAALKAAQQRIGVTAQAQKWLTWGIVSVEALP